MLSIAVNKAAKITISCKTTKINHSDEPQEAVPLHHFKIEKISGVTNFPTVHQDFMLASSQFVTPQKCNEMQRLHVTE